MTKRVLKISLVDESDDGRFLAIALSDELAADCAKIEHPHALRSFLFECLTDMVARLPPMVAKAVRSSEQLTVIGQFQRGEIAREELERRFNLDSTPAP